MGALGIAFAHPRVIILASLVRKESVALSGCLVWQTHEETLLFNVDVFSVDAADFANPETSFLRDSGSKAKTWVGDFALVDSGLTDYFRLTGFAWSLFGQSRSQSRHRLFTDRAIEKYSYCIAELLRLECTKR
jgi:hypothetical protein